MPGSEANDAYMVSTHRFYVFWATVKYTEEACNVREMAWTTLVACLMGNLVSFRETEEAPKLLPNFYEQPSKNEHFHLIQIYKFKRSVQFGMAYHFQIAYVPENRQSIKKYQRGGDKRLSGSEQQKWISLQQVAIRGERDIPGNQQHYMTAGHKSGDGR